MTDWHEGAGAVDTIMTAAKDLTRPEDWPSNAVAIGLEGLAFAANPLTGLLSAGLGWLIEHVSFLKEPLDDLAGDPEAIRLAAVVWGDDVSGQVAAARAELESLVAAETASWTGAAADAYRAKAATWHEMIGSLEPAAEAISTALVGSAAMVASVRAVIRDLIAEVVAELIIAAVAATASSWCTFGASIAAFAGWAVFRCTVVAGKIAARIGKLLMKLATVLSKFSRLEGAAQALAKQAKRMGDMAQTLGRRAGAARGRAVELDTNVARRRAEPVEMTPQELKDTVADRIPLSPRQREYAEFADEVLAKADTGAGHPLPNLPGLGASLGAEITKETTNADDKYDDLVEEQRAEQSAR